MKKKTATPQPDYPVSVIKANAVAAQLDVTAIPRNIWIEAISRPIYDPPTLNSIEDALAKEGQPFEVPEGFAMAILEAVEGEADIVTMRCIRRLLVQYADAFNAEGTIRGEAGFLLGFACGRRAAGVR